MPCGKGRPCPAEMEQRLQEYSDTTQQLEKQLGDMECEVRNMQNELVSVQKERMHLEQHRRMLCQPPCQPTCTAPCPPVCFFMYRKIYILFDKTKIAAALSRSLQ